MINDRDISCLSSIHKQRTLVDFNDFKEEVEGIVNGISIQNDKNRKLHKHVQQQHYVCALQVYFVGEGVKNTAFVGQIGIEERKQTNMVIIRLHIAHQTVVLSKSKRENGSTINQLVAKSPLPFLLSLKINTN